jgi:hypothetical protein
MKTVRQGKERPFKSGLSPKVPIPEMNSAVASGPRLASVVTSKIALRFTGLADIALTTSSIEYRDNFRRKIRRLG